MNSPFAIRRRPDWRLILGRFGILFTIGGGLFFVSTPALGATCFALGLLALFGASVE